MNHLFNQHSIAFRVALKRFFSQPFSSVLVLIMLGLALSLPLCLYLSVESLSHILSRLNISPTLTVFLQDNITEEQLSALSAKLKEDPSIASLKYMDKEEALKNLSRRLNEEDLLSTFSENPLPDAFNIEVRKNDPEAIENLTEHLNTLPEVNEVSVDSRWAKSLYHGKEAIKSALWALTFALGLTFLLIIYNITRLQILTRRQEIEVAYFLGAPKSFIRRPFLYEAFGEALLTSLLGIGLSTALWLKANHFLKRFLAPYGFTVKNTVFSLPEILLIFLIIYILAVCGTLIATQLFLKQGEKSL